MQRFKEFLNLWIASGILAILLVCNPKYSLPLEASPKQQKSTIDASNSQILKHATDLSAQGTELLQQGRYREAEPLLQEALKITRETLGPTHSDVAIHLYQLAVLYRENGRYAEAEPLFEESLEIARETLGPTHSHTATSLDGLASLYRAQGRYAEAEPLFEESLEIARETLGPTHSNVATTLQGIASLYRDQGRYSEAEPLYMQALEIYRETLGEIHPYVAQTLNNLALLYRSQRRPLRAEPLFQQALEINLETLGDTHPHVALTLNNLALLYSERDRYSEAEPLFLEALEIYRKTLGDTHPYVAPSLNNLALLYWKQGRPGEAEPLLQQTLAIAQERLGDTHPKVALTLNNLALMQQAKGDIENAIVSFQRSLRIQEKNLELNLINLSEPARQDYIATILHRTYQSVSFHLHEAPDTPAAAQLALNTILRRKGRLLDTSVNSLERLRRNLTATDQATLEQLIETRRSLSALIFNPSTNFSTDQYQTQLDQLEAEANSLELTLARSSARFRRESVPIEIEQVQNQIPKNGVLAEYMRYRPFDVIGSKYSWGEDEHYVAYLLFPDGRIEAVDLGGAASIEAAVRDFRQALQGGAPRTYTYNEQPGSALKSLIFDPIAPYLGNSEHLLISPDGQLNQIPFEALKTAGADEYLVQQYQISYLSSGRDLLKLNVSSPSRQPTVIVANPDYDTASIQVTQAATRSPNSRSSDMAQLRFNALPGTAAEAKAIAPLFPDATVLTGTQATENALKALDAPRILHIATHGFFFNDVRLAPNRNSLSSSNFATVNNNGGGTTAVVENPLLRSGLVLAGFNSRKSGTEDGVLTALEAANLNLEGTQLVVLSACDTGLGDIANGEGVYGLRRSFAIAGAESQLMSLWWVSDEGTQTLMSRYYKNLEQGMGRSEALREVQLELLDDPQYNYPYYWASFILTGDWKPLE